jgi:hypothetical protein
MLTVSGISVLQQPGDTIPRPLVCNRSLGGSVAVLHDGVSEATLPWSAVVPLEHTTDPLAFPQPSLSRAPRNVSFRQMVLSRSAPPERGGIPRTDEIRYALMTGDGPSSLPAGQRDDYSVLVSCGPFPVLEPGQILQFSCALVAAKDLAELRVAMANAALLQFGTELNLLADTLGRDSTEWFVGETGKNGHEVCLEAPSGTEFRLDPHCTNGLSRYGIDPPFQPEVIYRHGNCIWTNADCDWCTGVAGIDARLRWLDPGSVPPAPEFRAVPGDHKITVEWNNLSEVLLSAGVAGVAGARFGGYRIYKLLDWRRRESLLPPQDNWALWADVSVDTALGRIPFDVVRDTTVAHERILYRQKLYPVGRYRIEDSEVLNGFDYAYAVVAYATRLTNTVPSGIERLESPLAATFQDVVRPVFPPSESGPRVRVVPNPYRGSADWDRPQVFGDVFTSHLDFIGLPEGRSTIKIWTVAGDFVAQLDHDSANGGGQAPWNLISRNGQAIASGIYLFTVQSERGDARGRFVVIR